MATLSIWFELEINKDTQQLKLHYDRIFQAFNTRI
jgi:hypothetical protein